MFEQTPETSPAFHFIGIGGIGMSGLAEVLHHAGFTVQGSDTSENENVLRLRALGIQVYAEHHADNIAGAGVAVMSSAIPPDNVERLAAADNGLTTLHRADVLAALMENFYTICVTGTHGKTSTTALIWSALRAAGVDVGIISGGMLNSLGTNAVLPATREGILVVEADESDQSFLKLPTDIGIVTNIEPEHMENYGSEQQLLAAFEQFIGSVRQTAIICGEDLVLTSLADRTGTDYLSYGWEDFNDVYANTPAPQGYGMAFDATVRGGKLDDVVVNLPGRHYVLNALAALATTSALKLNPAEAVTGLANFAGVARRFSRVGQYRGTDVIDDYAHHPTEITTTLEATKQIYAKGRVVSIIEPHRYSRLAALIDDFAKSVKVTDFAIILPVYAAGETADPALSQHVLAEKMAAHDVHAIGVDEASQLPKILQEFDLKPTDAILFMGAGRSTTYAKNLVLE